ncbi:MAG: diaminopimelate decarboxylase [Candidatus Riflebacteria bacterium]|nr:diaminopimelate decarboxylase [Candidatus Riflebacteria bacterium]
MAREYVKPRILQQKEGMMNKFGAVASRFMDAIEGVKVGRLVDEYGSPLFVLSERAIRQQYRHAVREFSLLYPRVQFSWSYKTNYLDAVCALYHQEGSWAEVVSEFEYEKAVKLGVPGEKIIFNGPYKPYEALKTAARRKSKIHIDHMEEIAALERIARELKQPVEVAIRMNMDTGIYPMWSRFGFNLENQEAFAAVSRIQTTGKLVLKGLHCHIGTFIMEPNAYKVAVQKMVAFTRKIRDEFGVGIEYLDLGGGFPSTNTLHGQYLPGSQANLGIGKYAEAICGELNRCGSLFDKPPLLLLESGRALIDEAGFLIASVVARKRLSDGTAALVLDAGINTLVTAAWYKHEFIPAQAYSEILENTILYGPLCMNIDVVRPLISFPALSAGERVVIHPVGAYNMTQWMQFIRYRPAIVLIDTKGSPHVVRKAEDLAYLTELEEIPAHIREKKFRGRLA